MINILNQLDQFTAESPNTAILFDEAHTKGITYEQLTQEIIAEHTVIVNCTPLGMFPETDKMPLIPYEYITTAHLLFDCIYNPPLTEFLRRGQETGARICNGNRMLIRQAEAAWEIWNV